MIARQVVISHLGQADPGFRRASGKGTLEVVSRQAGLMGHVGTGTPLIQLMAGDPLLM
jgi:hypothetical protein